MYTLNVFSTKTIRVFIVALWELNGESLDPIQIRRASLEHLIEDEGQTFIALFNIKTKTRDCYYLYNRVTTSRHQYQRLHHAIIGWINPFEDYFEYERSCIDDVVALCKHHNSLVENVIPKKHMRIIRQRYAQYKEQQL